MGKLIQCSSRLADEPYCFPMTKTKVYSMEEVCYYIRNNIYMMQEEVFDKSFADWIRNELGMEVTADKLDKMRQDHNNLKDIVVTLCCSCDYYTEPEINGLIKIMDETENLSLWEKQLIKAESFLKSQSLEKARQEYESLLKSPDMLNVSSEEYGQIYHGLGMACAGMGEFKQASAAFQKAYEYNGKMESLQSYLYSLRLGGFEQEYQKMLKELDLSSEKQHFINSQYDDIMYQSIQERECRQIAHLMEQKDQGRMEYKERAREIIQRWKQEYRQTMM